MRAIRWNWTSNSKKTQTIRLEKGRVNLPFFVLLLDERPVETRACRVSFSAGDGARPTSTDASAEETDFRIPGNHRASND